MSFGLCNHCGEDFDKFEARKFEAAAKEASCAGQATLVSSQASLHRAIREQDQTPVPQTFNASFKRSGTSSTATCSNGECSESASLEMPRLSENGKGYCRLLPTLWKLLGLLLGQELCAPECAAGSLCGLWESEMAVTKCEAAVISKSKEKKEAFTIPKEAITNRKQREAKRWQTKVQRDIGKRQRKCCRDRTSAVQDFGSPSTTSSDESLCFLSGISNDFGSTSNVFELPRSPADVASDQVVLSGSQSNSISFAAVDNTAWRNRGQGSNKESAQGDHKAWTSTKAFEGDKGRCCGLRSSVERSCSQRLGIAERTKGSFHGTKRATCRSGKEGHHRAQRCEKGNRKVEQSRGEDDGHRRGGSQGGGGRTSIDGDLDGGYLIEAFHRTVCRISGSCGDYCSNAQCSCPGPDPAIKASQARDSFSTGQRAICGSPAKVTLSQEATWHFFCEHDDQQTELQLPHAFGLACLPKRCCFDHLFEHSVTLVDDFVSPERARQQALDLQEEVEREDHGDGTLPFPPTMTLRPNQEIQRAFDDDIPYYHRSAQGIVYRGRILPPPGWSDNPLFRTAWTTGASFRDAHGALIVRIRSWFIKHGDPIERTHRDFSMRPQLLVHLHDAVRRIWLDKINQQEVSLVHPVRPTPMADPDGSRLSHIIIEVSRPALCTSHPMLLAVRQISAHGVADQVQWIPTLLPHPFTTEEVLRVAQVPCELHQLLVPLAGRIRRWMNPYHQRDALPGLFLPVWWDLRLRPFQPQPYGDEQNLLQQVAKLKTISSRLTDQGEATAPDIEVCQQGDEVRAQPHVPPRLFDDIAASAFHQNFGILVANGANPQRGVQAETFGLHVQHIGQRTIVLRDFEASTILHEIRRVWMDVRHPFKAILANPPPEDSTQIVFIVEFQDAHRPPIPGTTPVIQRVFDQEEVGTRTRAAYHIGAVNPYLLLGQVPLRHRCEPWGPLRCTVRRNGEIVLPLAQPALTEGDWLDFFVYPNRSPDDDDEALQLMQTRASSRTPRRTPTSQDTTEGTVMAHVFHMSTEHRLVVLDRTKPLTFVDQIAEIWVLPPHVRVSELHQVLQLPADLESTADATFLVEMTADRGRQALPTDQLILFDLFIADAGSLATPSHIRKVLWARKSMQRSSFLHLVASQAFCSSPDNTCTLSINNVVWPEDDEAPRQFVNGDYLRLHVAGPPSMPATDVQLVLCEQEMAEVHRYIFRSSPTPSPLPSPEPSEAGESEQGGEGDEVVEVVASSHDIIEITDDEDEIFVDADCQVEPTRYEKAMSPLKDITNISLPISSAKPVSRESVLVTDVDDKSWQECPSKTTPCLDELVPEKKHALITLRGIEELAEKCLENRTSLEIAIPSVDCMALEVLSQLDFCSYEDVKECPPEKFSIYTDGSKLWNDENLLTQSAWAFVVVAKWPDDPKEWVIGFQHGAVCVQPDHVSWIGATEQDSYQAEVVALIYATLWLCQEPLFYSGTPCELVADSTSALFGADGTFQIHHPTLSKVLRPLQRFASAFAPIQYRWQKAHAGEPHNELADHLAKCAARDKEPKYPSIPFQLSNDLLTLQWIWLSAERINDTNLPAVMSDGIEVPVPAPMQSKDIATEKEHDEGAMHLDLLITSFNVNSFKDAKASWSGRAELIRAQTVESGSVVNAWQETRRRQGGQWKSAHHFGFEAAAKGGAGGVALWFRHDIPFAVRTENEGSHPCYFQLNDFVVEVAEPELLIVRYHSPIWKAIFVSAHAPNDLAEDKVKNQFWQGIKKNLAKWVSEPVFLCIDANARLGTRMSSAVGAFAAEEETDNGFRFHDLLLQNRLFVPSTFEGMVDRPSDEQGTWLAKNGWKRIDYVALPQQLFDAVLRTWTTIFDKDVVKEDHRAVSLHLQVSLLLDKWKAPYAHPTLPIDRVAMQTPEGKAICSDILSYMSAQQPPWEVSADVQANFLNAAASQCLPQHFPQTKRKPKPTWIQQDTWDEFKVAKRWRNQLRSLRQLESAGLLRTIFRHWATSSKCEEDFSRWIRAVDVATAQALHQLKVTQSQRIKLLRRDEAAYFDVCANQRQDELTEAKGAQLWKCLKTKGIFPASEDVPRGISLLQLRMSRCTYTLLELRRPSSGRCKTCVQIHNGRVCKPSRQPQPQSLKEIRCRHFLSWRKLSEPLRVGRPALAVSPLSF